MNGFPMLTLLTLIPFFGAIMVLGIERERKELVRHFGLGFSLLTLILTGSLWFQFDGGTGQLQFVERVAWIPSLGVDYFLGVDGLGLLMVLLSALIVPFAMLPNEPAVPFPDGFAARPAPFGVSFAGYNLSGGIAMNSAIAPSRCTPRVSFDWQAFGRPRRHDAHFPQLL